MLVHQSRSKIPHENENENENENTDKIILLLGARYLH